MSTSKIDGVMLLSSGIPIGTSVSFRGSSAPSGWLFEAGQAVSRTTYAALFSVIGTTYGTGDGSKGGDQAHPNVQPTLVANKIIYAGV